jgi:hypothetical protein
MIRVLVLQGSISHYFVLSYISSPLTASILLVSISISTIDFQRHFLPRTSILTFVNNLLPPEHLFRILNILNRREIMFVFLHSGDPGYIVKGHDLEAKVLVVSDFLDFGEEGGEVWCGDVVYMCEEIRWCELEDVR